MAERQHRREQQRRPAIHAHVAVHHRPAPPVRQRGRSLRQHRRRTTVGTPPSVIVDAEPAVADLRRQVGNEPRVVGLDAHVDDVGDAGVDPLVEVVLHRGDVIAQVAAECQLWRDPADARHQSSPRIVAHATSLVDAVGQLETGS